MNPSLLLLLAGFALAAEAAAQEKKPVPLYTNEDLDRVSPFRGQTGALSVPAVPVTDGEPREGPQLRADRGEDYWRQEAGRVRDRVSALRDRAEEMRRELHEARTAPRSRRSPVPSLASREARLAALERRIRDMESELQDRARRAGALPGWLR